MNGVEVVSSLLKVAVVFVLLYATLRGLAKYQGRKSPGRRTAGRGARRTIAPLVEVLDQSSLGRSATAVAVRVGERVLLLGVTETDVSTLADVSDDVDLTPNEADDADNDRVLDHALDILRSGAFRG